MINLLTNAVFFFIFASLYEGDGHGSGAGRFPDGVAREHRQGTAVQVDPRLTPG